MTDQTSVKRSDLAELLASLPECMGADVEPLVCAPSRDASVSCADVIDTAERMGIDFIRASFTAQQLHLGMAVEADQRRTDESVLMDEDLLELGIIAAKNLERQLDYYVQLTSAHAPGDPLPVTYHLADIGTD